MYIRTGYKERKAFKHKFYDKFLLSFKKTVNEHNTFYYVYNC